MQITPKNTPYFRNQQVANLSNYTSVQPLSNQKKLIQTATAEFSHTISLEGPLTARNVNSSFEVQGFESNQCQQINCEKPKLDISIHLSFSEEKNVSKIQQNNDQSENIDDDDNFSCINLNGNIKSKREMMDSGYRSSRIFVPNPKSDYIPKQLLFKPPVSYPVQKKEKSDQTLTNLTFVTNESPQKIQVQIGESLTTTVFQAGNTYDSIDFQQNSSFDEVPCVTENSHMDYDCKLALERHVRKQEKLVNNEKFNPFDYFGAIDVDQMPDEDVHFDLNEKLKVMMENSHPKIRECFHGDESLLDEAIRCEKRLIKKEKLAAKDMNPGVYKINLQPKIVDQQKVEKKVNDSTCTLKENFHKKKVTFVKKIKQNTPQMMLKTQDLNMSQISKQAQEVSRQLSDLSKTMPKQYVSNNRSSKPNLLSQFNLACNDKKRKQNRSLLRSKSKLEKPILAQKQHYTLNNLAPQSARSMSRL